MRLNPLHNRCHLTLLVLAAAATSCLAQPTLITTGWDVPNAAQFRRNVAEFERWGVFDGTTIRPTRSVAGGPQQDSRYAFSSEPWAWKEFAEPLADLRAATPETCRETFLMVYANPGDVDWFDDPGWQEVVNHWRLLSRLARQGGLRGLLYDAEPYEEPFSQFRYAAQAGRAEHSFAEYQVQARKRGREVMRAITEEFPDVTIFTYRLFSDLLGLLDSGDLARALEPVTYGLQPAFVDGWMDVAPGSVTIVEGTESIGYRANSPAEYNAAFTRQRLRSPEFLSPENRAGFARQLRIGQSLYLDAHVNPPESKWTIDRTDSTPAGRLAANLASALAASDGIVWLYGEQARWWPEGKPGSILWVDKLPGALAAIRRAKDPAGFARSIFASGQQVTNLLTNAVFLSADGKVPTGWFAWQAADSQGDTTCTDGRVEIRGAGEAVIGFVVKVQPGADLAARLLVKSAGGGLGSLNLGWKTAAGKWTAHAKNGRFVPTDPPGSDGWQEIVALIEVPPEAGQAVFMAAASGQWRPTDLCQFSEPILTAVPPNE